MVCLGTHPYRSCRIVPIYKKNRIHPMKLKGTIYVLAFWVFEALLLPSTNRNILELVFLFSHKDKRNNFLPLLFGCLKPFLLPSSNRNTLVFVFNIPMKIKGRISVLVFRVWTLSPSPQRKIASQSGLPQIIEWELKMNDLITLGKRGRWMKS